MKLELTLLNTSNQASFKPVQAIFDHSGGGIGRSGDCDLVLDCHEKVVSRLHAKVTFERDVFYLTDVSANGVTFNGGAEPIDKESPKAISDGDVIRIGSFEIKVQVQGRPSAVAQQSIIPPEGEPEIPLKPNLLEDVIPPPSDTAKDADAAEDLFYSQTTDHFIPPSAAIPEDWDMDFGLDSKPVEPEPQSVAPQFVSQDENLVSHLLKGMGVDKELSSGELTPEAMAIIGRTLRTAVNGVMMSRQWLYKAKVNLCSDFKVIDKYGEVNSLDSIDNVDMFMKALVDSHSRNHLTMAKELAGHYKESLEDLQVIYDSIDDAVEQAGCVFRPDAIERAFSDPDFVSSKKMSPWDFYNKNWDQLLGKVKSSVGRHYEARMLAIAGKRSKNTQVDSH